MTYNDKSMWYVLMILATGFSAPSAVRNAGTIPVADSMAHAFGHPVWGKVCIFGALCGIITSWNGLLFGAARCIQSMAEDGMLPSVFGRIHSKYNTPYVSILFCAGVCAVTAFAGEGALSWFVNSASFGTVIMYMMVVLSFIVLRVRQPELPRPYKIKNAKIVGTMAVLVVGFFVYLYLPVGPSALVAVEWVMVLGWFVLGIVLFAIQKGRPNR